MTILRMPAGDSDDDLLVELHRDGDELRADRARKRGTITAHIRRW